MKIRVLKSFAGYRPGQEFEWGDGMARVLVARGMVQEIQEPAVEAAVIEHRAERAAVEHAVRRKVK